MKNSLQYLAISACNSVEFKEIFLDVCGRVDEPQKDLISLPLKTMPLVMEVQESLCLFSLPFLKIGGEISKWHIFPKLFSNRPRKMDASITREKGQNSLDWEHEIKKIFLLIEL